LHLHGSLLEQDLKPSYRTPDPRIARLRTLWMSSRFKEVCFEGGCFWKCR